MYPSEVWKQELLPLHLAILIYYCEIKYSNRSSILFIKELV